jgi:hypothetical protein
LHDWHSLPGLFQQLHQGMAVPGPCQTQVGSRRQDRTLYCAILQTCETEPLQLFTFPINATLDSCTYHPAQVADIQVSMLQVVARSTTNIAPASTLTIVPIPETWQAFLLLEVRTFPQLSCKATTGGRSPATTSAD